MTRGIRAAALGTIGALALVAGATTANAATPTNATAAPKGHTPAAGIVYNDPAGTTAKRYAIQHQIQDALYATPKGATVRMSLFSGSLPGMRDALLAAAKRGVHLRLVMAQINSNNAWWRALQNQLGTDRNAVRFAVTCQVGCFSKADSTFQHTKAVMFSKVGSASHVALVASSNPTYSQTNNAWNNQITITDQKIYSGLAADFDAKAARSALTPLVATDHYQVIGSGSRTLITMPDHGQREDYYTSQLKRIDCKAPKGFGGGGHTRVRVLMGTWSENRANIAQRLWTLDDAGCDVEVIATTSATANQAMNWLRKPTRNGGIVLRPAAFDMNSDGIVDRYMHEKVLMVDGSFGGAGHRVMFMGSANFTQNSWYGNDEVIVKTINAAEYERGQARIVSLRKRVPVLPPDSAAARNLAPRAKNPAGAGQLVLTPPPGADLEQEVQ